MVQRIQTKKHVRFSVHLREFINFMEHKGDSIEYVGRHKRKHRDSGATLRYPFPEPIDIDSFFLEMSSGTNRTTEQ